VLAGLRKPRLLRALPPSQSQDPDMWGCVVCVTTKRSQFCGCANRRIGAC
jgi:hypothetical protein